MKKLVLAAAIIASICVGSFAQNETKQAKPKKMKAKTSKMATKSSEKAHVCTQTCHDEGHCVYAHGEKGHSCTEACKKM